MPVEVPILSPMATLSTKRKPIITYGKQSRRLNKTFPQEFASQRPSPPTPSRLSRVTPSPSCHKSDGFVQQSDPYDIPSSDGESKFSRSHTGHPSQWARDSDRSRKRTARAVQPVSTANRDIKRRRLREISEEDTEELMDTENVNALLDEQLYREIEESEALGAPYDDLSRAAIKDVSQFVDNDHDILSAKLFSSAGRKGGRFKSDSTHSIKKSSLARNSHTDEERNPTKQEHAPKKPPKAKKSGRDKLASEYSRSGVTNGSYEGSLSARAMSPMPSLRPSERIKNEKAKYRSQSPLRNESIEKTTSFDNDDSSVPTPMAPQPTSTSDRKGLTTPRQARLWSDILEKDGSASPSFALRKLSLEQKVKPTEGSPERNDRPSGKKKLIASLGDKPSGSENQERSPASHFEEEDEEEEEEEEATEFEAPNLRDSVSISQDYELPQHAQRGRSIGFAPKVTYAGERSYLADTSNEPGNTLTEPLVEETGLEAIPSWETSLSMHTRVEQDTEVEDEPKTVRTIHELRAAGDSERFTHEISTIMDDLTVGGKSALSRKRGALLDINARFCEEGFRVRFLQHGYEYQFFHKCALESDPVIGSCVAAAVIKLLGSENESADPIQIVASGVCTLLHTTLGIKRDLKEIARERGTNMSRSSQSMLLDLKEDCIKRFNSTSAQRDHISPMSLALGAFDILTRRLRESKWEGSLVNIELLSTVLELLGELVETSTADSEHKLFELKSIYSFLESCTIASACVDDFDLWTIPNLERLSRAMDMSLSKMRPQDQSLECLILRLCINLANNHSSRSAAFARTFFIGQILSNITSSFNSVPQEPKELESLDVLLLSLGAMINLAECSDVARKVVVQQHHGLLENLLEIFRRSRKRTDEAESLAASQVNVAFGWLAILLGSLCLDVEVRAIANTTLKGSGVHIVLEAVEEFIRHHEEADKREEGNEAYVMFTRRLRSVAQALHALEGS